MLNYLWGFMIIIGVLFGAFTGNIQAVADGALDSAKEAVTLCITMLGVMSLWTGLMEIANKSGLITSCTRKIAPFMHWLFPNVPKDHDAMRHMTMNVIANILGLGWAATPAGLKAMKSLEELEEERRQTAGDGSQSPAARGPLHVRPEKRLKLHPAVPRGTASNEMCTFLVLNISSLQLIPVNMIAYRSQYGSVNPTGIVGAGIVATFVSTVVAIIFCKWIAVHFKK